MNEHLDRDQSSRPLRPYRSPTSETEQLRAFREGAVPVAVYGLGKMGLPLAAVYADVCGNVIGADVEESVVERIAAGECPVDNEPGLCELVADRVAAGALEATTDPRTAAATGAIHVVVVPTLIEDGEPDLSALAAVCTAIGDELDPGDLVFVESTVPPRTCRHRVTPKLANVSGLRPDQFGVAACPERTASGRALRDIRGAYPKIVGGVDAEGGRAAELIYEQLNDSGVIRVPDATTAEAVKVFEGVYRDVNIALANELAQYADDLGIDIREAIRAANTQPYCDLHDPGPGVGGHCIPYYPYFLFETFDRRSPVLRAARQVNDWMPAYTVGKLIELLADQQVDIEDAIVLVLGITYRPGVAETRASPAIDVAEVLSDLGARPVGVDPLIDDWTDLPLEEVPLEAVESTDVDGVVLVTPHEAFDDIDWDDFDAPLAIVDGRDALDVDAVDDPEKTIHTIGVGSRDRSER